MCHPDRCTVPLLTSPEGCGTAVGVWCSLLFVSYCGGDDGVSAVDDDDWSLPGVIISGTEEQ